MLHNTRPIWKTCAILQYHIQGKLLRLGQIQKQDPKLTILRIEHPTIKTQFDTYLLANILVTVAY